MRRSGRASLVAIAAVASVLVIGVILLMSRRGPAPVAAEFMDALARGDARRLAKVSAIGDDEEATRLKKWQKTIERGRHYLFIWQLVEVDQMTSDSGAARVRIVRNATMPNAYEETYELPMVRKPDGWKVDVPSVNREVYPSLPTVGKLPS